MRAFRRHFILLRYFVGMTSINCDDPGWRRDIDEECLGFRVVDRPTGTARNLDFGHSLPAPHIDDRCSIRIRNSSVAHICNDQKTATIVECYAIRFDADADLETVAF